MIFHNGALAVLAVLTGIAVSSADVKADDGTIPAMWTGTDVMTDGGAVSVLGDVPLGGGLSLEVGYERLVLPELTYFYDPSSTEGGLDATSTGFGIVTRGVLHSRDRARVTIFHSTSRSEDRKAALGRVLPGWASGALPLSERFWIKRGRQLGVRLGYQRMLNGAGITETYFYLERRRGHRLISSPTAAIGARIKIKF